MKKNAMLKIAAILMVAVLLTTCAISSTFAKYTTNGTDTATARVAKWGVTVTNEISALFVNEYGEFSNTTGHVKAEDGQTTYNGIIAPGTENSIELTSVASGTPEVSVTISYELDVDFSGALTSYNPIKWSVNGAEWGTLDQAIADIADLSVTYDAGTDLSTAKSDDAANITIAWKWAFDGDDEKDTNLLGNWELNKQEVPTVTVTLTTTVDQSATAGKPVN